MKLNKVFSLILIFITGFIFGQHNRYPFSKASKIELVIFENFEQFDENWSKLNCMKVPIENGKIDTSKILKRKQLNVFEIDALLDVVNFKKNDCSENVSEKEKCNESGYAVVFYDNAEQILEYFELCFNCKEFQTSSDRMDLGLMCPDKYYQFEKLFNRTGLQVIRYRDE